MPMLLHSFVGVVVQTARVVNESERLSAFGYVEAYRRVGLGSNGQ